MVTTSNHNWTLLTFLYGQFALYWECSQMLTWEWVKKLLLTRSHISPTLTVWARGFQGDCFVNLSKRNAGLNRDYYWSLWGRAVYYIVTFSTKFECYDFMIHCLNSFMWQHGWPTLEVLSQLLLNYSHFYSVNSKKECFRMECFRKVQSKDI